jgi:putative transposase
MTTRSTPSPRVFFATLKAEHVANEDFPGRGIARAWIADYIERFYNTARRRSSLGYVGPIELNCRRLLRMLERSRGVETGQGRGVSEDTSSSRLIAAPRGLDPDSCGRQLTASGNRATRVSPDVVTHPLADVSACSAASTPLERGCSPRPRPARSP